MKAVTVRLKDEEAERLEQLKRDLKNTDAGVVRFALELLYKTISQKGVLAVDGPQPDAKPA